tara:strand:- start:54 stop:473 length:420 start_codon:yes stop_codon:yes gene_type:complete
MGKTWSGPDHGDAFKFFHVTKVGPKYENTENDHMCTAVAKKGYDSIQFLQHDYVIKDCDVIGKVTNYELVSTKLKGLYACTSSDGKSSLIRKGWMGAEACECDVTQGYINCDGVPFLQWNPSRGLPAMLNRSVALSTTH